MATVVEIFFSTPARSSTPTLAAVIRSSVSSGATSLTEPTMVVLPTPNPPAMRIFKAVGMTGSEPTDTIHHPFDEFHARLLAQCGRGLDNDQRAVEEVTTEHLHHVHWQVQLAGDLGHRHRAVPAQCQDRHGLRLQVVVVPLVVIP